MNWYKALTENEKHLVKWGTIIIAVAFSWNFIYQPVTNLIVAKKKQVASLNQQFEEMMDSKDQLKIQQEKQVKYYRDRNKPFSPWVDGQLEKRNLMQYVTRSEPKGNKTVILTFEAIIFDDLANWLEPLELNYNIKISEADVNLLDRSQGSCNARITLQET